MSAFTVDVVRLGPAAPNARWKSIQLGMLWYSTSACRSWMNSPSWRTARRTERRCRCMIRRRARVEGQVRRPQSRGRRLSDKAVRDERDDRPNQGPVAVAPRRFGITLEAAISASTRSGGKLRSPKSRAVSRQELANPRAEMRRGSGASCRKLSWRRSFTALTRSRTSNTIPVHIHHLRRQVQAAVVTRLRSTRSDGVGYILPETRMSRRH